MITASLKRQVTLKRIIIIAYVLSVLMIAGLTQASELSAMSVTKVQFDGNSQVILVEGFRGNACQRAPRPEVVSIDKRTRMVTMRIVSKGNGLSFCTQKVEGRYELVVGVASLRLPENVPFTLHFENSQNVAPIEVVSTGMADGFPFSSVDMTGILIQEADGFSIQTRSENFKVVPNDIIDLGKFAGEVVDVSGHKIEFGLMPVDELNESVNGELPQSLVVTGISSGN
ncbi:MAG TPA: hypothetical protein VFV50_18515 [Bdellovibrionales bacterium]|nr:hypothetical protein [Bdellovibrionales bacterium]